MFHTCKIKLPFGTYCRRVLVKFRDRFETKEIRMIHISLKLYKTLHSKHFSLWLLLLHSADVAHSYLQAVLNYFTSLYWTNWVYLIDDRVFLNSKFSFNYLLWYFLMKEIYFKFEQVNANLMYWTFFSHRYFAQRVTQCNNKCRRNRLLRLDQGENIEIRPPRRWHPLSLYCGNCCWLMRDSGCQSGRRRQNSIHEQQTRRV